MSLSSSLFDASLLLYLVCRLGYRNKNTMVRPFARFFRVRTLNVKHIRLSFNDDDDNMKKEAQTAGSSFQILVVCFLVIVIAYSLPLLLPTSN